MEETYTVIWKEIDMAKSTRNKSTNSKRNNKTVSEVKKDNIDKVKSEATVPTKKPAPKKIEEKPEKVVKEKIEEKPVEKKPVEKKPVEKKPVEKEAVKKTVKKGKLEPEQILVLVANHISSIMKIISANDIRDFNSVEEAVTVALNELEGNGKLGLDDPRANALRSMISDAVYFLEEDQLKALKLAKKMY